MALSEAVLLKLGLLGADLATDLIMDFVAEKKKEGIETITVAELELFAINVKKQKDTEIAKIKARQNT